MDESALKKKEKKKLSMVDLQVDPKLFFDSPMTTVYFLFGMAGVNARQGADRGSPGLNQLTFIERRQGAKRWADSFPGDSQQATATSVLSFVPK